MSKNQDLDRRVRALAFLRKYDVPCPGCGYNLRGNTTARCSECGREFDPVALMDVSPRDLDIGEVISHPWIRYGLIAVNLIAAAVLRLRSTENRSIGFEALLVVLLIAFFATWDATERDRLEHGPRNTRHLSWMLVGMLAFGLSRIKGAIVWSPLAAAGLTLIHIAYSVFVR